MTDYFDLGTYGRANAAAPDAQIWMDRGLNWLFAYNHDDAIVCFDDVLETDPTCALAHWAIAYCLGPNYNKPWEVIPLDERTASLARAKAEIEAGLAIKGTSKLVQALFDAIGTRYPNSPDHEDIQPFNDAFAREMTAILADHPNDLDVLFFCVEALMNRTPWQLWDTQKGIPNPIASTHEALAILEQAFDTTVAAWDHPGLLHMYIHLMEMSPHPERALRHGDRLTGLVPDAGHLVHMATHIDVLCGDYQNVLSRNLAASVVDEKFVAYAGPANFYALYRIHNLHFAVYGAMFLGQKAAALDAARRLRANVPDEVVRIYPDLLETFVAVMPHVYIRFGMWSEILELEAPQDKDLYVTTNALILYAKAVALANLGHHQKAEDTAAAFMTAQAAVPPDRKLFQNKACDVLAVAEQMMWGELAFKSGRQAKGLDRLRRSVALDDALMYEEPWSWPQPARHALGALLMDAGEFDEAEAVYRADLGLDPGIPRPRHHPRNVWALHGLHECLTRRGEKTEVRHIKLMLDQAVARSDVPIVASCLCRKSRVA